MAIIPCGQVGDGGCREGPSVEFKRFFGCTLTPYRVCYFESRGTRFIEHPDFRLNFRAFLFLTSLVRSINRTNHPKHINKQKNNDDTKYRTKKARTSSSTRSKLNRQTQAHLQNLIVLTNHLDAHGSVGGGTRSHPEGTKTPPPRPPGRDSVRFKIPPCLSAHSTAWTTSPKPLDASATAAHWLARTPAQIGPTWRHRRITSCGAQHCATWPKKKKKVTFFGLFSTRCRTR